MKPQVYKDPRPAEHFDRFHERQRAKRPNWAYELVRLLLTPRYLGAPSILGSPKTGRYQQIVERIRWHKAEEGAGLGAGAANSQ